MAFVNSEPRYVYKLTFPNGMVYIGRAHSVEQRWANNGAHYKGQKVYDAIQAFGWENVKKEVVLYLSDNSELIKTIEKELIREHRHNSYNLSATPEYYDTVKGKLPRYKYLWTINGVTKSAKEWCAIYGIDDYTGRVGWTHRFGMTPIEAINCPVPPTGYYRRHEEEYWEKVGFKYGEDTTSYETPAGEWPEEYKPCRNYKG